MNGNNGKTINSAYAIYPNLFVLDRLSGTSRSFLTKKRKGKNIMRGLLGHESKQLTTKHHQVNLQFILPQFKLKTSASENTRLCMTKQNCAAHHTGLEAHQLL